MNPTATGGYLDGPASNNVTFSGFERVTINDNSGANAVLNGLASIDTLNGGTGDDELNGGGGNDTLNGGAGTDEINGGAGLDTMIGGTGNDFFDINDAASAAADKIVELAGGGTDTVRVKVSYTLQAASQVEFMRIEFNSSAKPINLTGNGFDQTILGGGGSNVINGGGGNDRLTGDYGRDFFLFNTALNAARNTDTITDFSVADDTIRLENTGVFTKLAPGVLAADAFHIGTAAADAEDRIIYNQSTGALSYDADGIGGVAAVRFAFVSSFINITRADFVVV